MMICASHKLHGGLSAGSSNVNYVYISVVYIKQYVLLAATPGQSATPEKRFMVVWL